MRFRNTVIPAQLPDPTGPSFRPVEASQQPITAFFAARGPAGQRIAAMGTVRVEVKWAKEVFKDVEIDLSQPPTVFKSQLFSLTGVPPERQKIMGVKGGLLKDDADWAKLGLKAGQKLSMMGTADKVPEAPQQQQTFMEDLPEEEQDTSGAWVQGMCDW